jgi:two-component system NtrC family response regulator
MHLPPALRIKVTKAQIMTAQSETENSDPEHGGASAVSAGRVKASPALSGPLPTFKDFKAEAEASYLERLAAETGGDVPLMLERSGLSRSHLYALLKKYSIDV